MSSVEENTLPDGWKWSALSDVCDVRDGTHDSPKYIDDGFPLITSKNLKNGKLDFEKIKFISKEDYTSINKRSQVNINDILFAMIGTIGNPVLIKEQPNYAIKNVALFKQKTDGIFMEFLNHLLDSPDVIGKMMSQAKGATQKFVGLTYLRSFHIPLPPLSEQKRIVSKIDNLFTKIDKAISLTEESLTQAKNLLLSSVKKIFEDGEKEGWKKLKFKDFALLRHGHQFRKYDYVENGIPVIKIGQCIPGNKLDLSKCNFIDVSRENEFSNDLIKKGDLLMALTGGTLGKVTWVKDDYGIVVQNYRVGNFFTDEKKSSKRFLMYSLLSPVFQSLMYSKINVAAQPNIGKEEIENLEFLLPSLEEQSMIVERLDELTIKANETEFKLKEQLAYLNQLKSSILSKAFKGEL